MASSKLQEYESIFRRFDKDNDGKISAAELQQLVKTVGEELTLKEAEAVIKASDSDGDGLLSLEDFIKLVDGGGKEEEEDKDTELREAFRMYEMEGEGCITVKSLKRMLSRLGSSRDTDACTVMIGCFDLDGDGVISFDEFRAMMLS